MKGSFSHQSLVLGLLYLLIFSNIVVIAIDSLTSPCNGSIAECYEGEEMLMESEISRRFLEQKTKHISYDVLIKDKPTCSKGAGKPYGKNCKSSEANPYDRGCGGIYNRCKT
ncbi:unnamed protein product [Citrullus colocynthis]|uniref:Rapid ALkalinization Factor n=1 Tax=Citrullus colocynthis TaxID=252529 RepID=A0ABP0YFP5_9ROSI